MVVAARDGVGRAAVWPPVECGCGRMAAFVVNRDGKTRCLDCDEANGSKPPFKLREGDRS